MSLEQVYGSTDIEKAFIYLNQILEEILEVKKYRYISIIFISDGGDNHKKTIESRLGLLGSQISSKLVNINFICVGVGSNFPTFMSMQLRNIYHKIGDNQTPPIILVEERTSMSEWSTIFGQIQTSLNNLGQAESKIPVLTYPFEMKQKRKTVNSGEWVFLEATGDANKLVDLQITHLEADQPRRYKIQQTRLSDLRIEQLAEIALKLTSRIQLKSLDKNIPSSIIIAEATKTYYLIFYLFKNLSSIVTDQQIILSQRSGEQQTPYHHSKNKLMNVFQILQQLRQGEMLINLEQFDAAKRLAIGTKTSKYHFQSLKIQPIAQDYLQNALQKFLIARDQYLAQHPISSQPPSLFLSQNQLDILKNPTLFQNFYKITDPYSVIQDFPIIGHPITIHRSHGSMIDPFLIQVKFIPQTLKTIDSQTLIQNGNEILFTDSDTSKSLINAVLPLYPQDSNFFVNLQLFNLLMTFNVVGNADTIYKSAYPALLTNATLYLVSQTNNPTLNASWAQQLLEGIYLTYENSGANDPLLYFGRKKNYIYHDRRELRDLSQVVFYLAYEKYLQDKKSARNNIGSDFEDPPTRQVDYENILQEMCIESFNRIKFKSSDIWSLFESDAELQNSQKNQATLQNYSLEVRQALGDLKSYSNTRELSNQIQNCFNRLTIVLPTSLKTEKQQSIRLDLNNQHLKTTKFSFQTLKGVWKYFGLDLDEQKYLELFLKSKIIQKKLRLNLNSESQFDAQNILRFCNKKRQLRSLKLAIWNRLQPIVQEYEEAMFKIHAFQINPQDQSLKNYLKDESNSLSSICFSPSCPFYLRTENFDIDLHLQKLKSKFMPSLIRACESDGLNPKITDKQILKNILQGKYIHQQTKNNLKENDYFTSQRDAYLKFINEIRQLYN